MQSNSLPGALHHTATVTLWDGTLQENDKAIQEKSSINEALRRANDVSAGHTSLQ